MEYCEHLWVRIVDKIFVFNASWIAVEVFNSQIISNVSAVRNLLSLLWRNKSNLNCFFFKEILDILFTIDQGTTKLEIPLYKRGSLEVLLTVSLMD